MRGSVHCVWHKGPCADQRWGQRSLSLQRVRHFARPSACQAGASGRDWMQRSQARSRDRSLTSQKLFASPLCMPLDIRSARKAGKAGVEPATSNFQDQPTASCQYITASGLRVVHSVCFCHSIGVQQFSRPATGLRARMKPQGLG